MDATSASDFGQSENIDQLIKSIELLSREESSRNSDEPHDDNPYEGIQEEQMSPMPYRRPSKKQNLKDSLS